MKTILIAGLIAVLVAILTGCEETNYGKLPYIEMEQDELTLAEHRELCSINPDSVFCQNSPSVGDIQPDSKYAKGILHEMNSNFKYIKDNTWHYNDTVHEYLNGDCEDISSTMAQHMISDGIGKEYLYLVYRLIGENEAHLFLAVDTSDKGLLHLDYSNSGYPIEPQINFHLPLDDVRVWVKGNIQ